MNGTRAQMSRPCCVATGSDPARGWELYVPLSGRPSTVWPEHRWPAEQHLIPTVAERTQALARLGYEPVSGAEWIWHEVVTEEWHRHAPGVRLLGMLTVRPVPGSGGRS